MGTSELAKLIMNAQTQILSAILMGDIVGSSKAISTKQLHREFNSGVKHFNIKYAHQICSPLTITLGDEFQGVIENLRTSFQIANEMRLYFLTQEIRCRFVISEGRIATPINPKKAWNMMGPGLTEARKRLNDKKDRSAYRFVYDRDPVIEDVLNGFGATMTEMEEGWTETQVKYVSAAYLNEGKTYKDLAEEFGVSERNVYKVMNAADVKLYQRQLDGVIKLIDRKKAGDPS